MVTESTSGYPEQWKLIPSDPATLDDLVTEARRIADALESFTGKKACDGAKNGKVCVLDPDHVGHHASSDGRLHWLDEE